MSNNDAGTNMQRMKTGAVIPAAGMSSRMDGFKPLLPVGQISAVRRIIMTLRQAGVDPIVLVTGYQAPLLEEHVADLDVVCLRNESYASTQMFDSIQLGLRHLVGQCGQALVVPVDTPLFTAETVQALVTCDSAVAVPVYHGRSGHPLRIRETLFADIVGFIGEGGLKAVFQASGCTVDRIELDDEGVLLGMNTPEEYRRLLEWAEKAKVTN